MVWCDAPTLAASFARGTLPDLEVATGGGIKVSSILRLGGSGD